MNADVLRSTTRTNRLAVLVVLAVFATVLVWIPGPPPSGASPVGDYLDELGGPGYHYDGQTVLLYPVQIPFSESEFAFLAPDGPDAHKCMWARVATAEDYLTGHVARFYVHLQAPGDDPDLTRVDRSVWFHWEHERPDGAIGFPTSLAEPNEIYLLFGWGESPGFGESPGELDRCRAHAAEAGYPSDFSAGHLGYNPSVKLLGVDHVEIVPDPVEEDFDGGRNHDSDRARAEFTWSVDPSNPLLVHIDANASSNFSDTDRLVYQVHCDGNFLNLSYDPHFECEFAKAIDVRITVGVCACSSYYEDYYGDDPTAIGLPRVDDAMSHRVSLVAPEMEEPLDVELSLIRDTGEVSGDEVLTLDPGEELSARVTLSANGGGPVAISAPGGPLAVLPEGSFSVISASPGVLPASVAPEVPVLLEYRLRAEGTGPATVRASVDATGSDGATRSISDHVGVHLLPPVLDVAVHVPPRLQVVGIAEEFDALIEVELRGDSPVGVENVHFDGTNGAILEVSDGDGTLELLSDTFAEGGGGPFSLQPGQKETFTARMKPTGAGVATLRSAVVATVAGSGAEIDGAGTVDVEVIPIELQVLIDHPNFLLNGNDAPEGNRFVAEIEVTNHGPDEVTDVRLGEGFRGPFGVDRLDGELGAPFSSVIDEENPPVYEIGSLGEGESRTLVFEFQATGGFHANLTTGLSATLDGRVEVIERGHEMRVRDDPLIKVRMHKVSTSVLAGHTLRFEGTVENVAEDETVALLAIPVVRYNSGGGHLFRTDDQASQGTPDSPIPIVLAPETTATVGAVIATAWSEVALDAEVEYVFHGFVHKADGSLTKISASQIDLGEAEDGNGTLFITRLLPNPPPVDDPYGDCGFGPLSCGLVRGLDLFGQGTVDMLALLPAFGGLLVDFGEYELQFIQWMGVMTGELTSALLGDEEAARRLYAEIATDIQAIIDAAGITGLQGLTVLQIVTQELSDFIGKLAFAYHEGDLETLKFELGKFIGENPDLVLEGALKVAGKGYEVVRALARQKLFSRSTKLLDEGNDARRVVEEGRAARTVQLRDELAQLPTGTPRESVLRAGDVLNHELVRKIYGVLGKDLDKLIELAGKENVIIAFRSRALAAAEKLATGLYLPKPEWLKIKTVNEIDWKYLGYRQRSAGAIELLEPPPRFRNPDTLRFDVPAKDDIAGFADFNRKLDDEMAVLAAEYPEIADNPKLYEAVRSRLEKRVTEYEHYAQHFGVAPPSGLHGVDPDGRWIDNGVPVGFDFQKQGISEDIAKGVSEQRALAVQEYTGAPPGRRGWAVLMEDKAGSGIFHGIAGDLDFVGFFRPDGGKILDDVKRKRIYDYIRDDVGMQHGESLSYDDDLVDVFLECCIEGVAGAQRFATISPNGDMNAAILKTLSTFDNSPNAVSTASGKRYLLEGPQYQLNPRRVTPIADQVAVAATYLEQLADFYSRFNLGHLLAAPGKLYQFVNGILEEQTPEQFDREAPPVRAGADGSLVTLAPQGGPPGFRSFGALTVPDAYAWVPLPTVNAPRDSEGRYRLAPITALSDPVPVGADSIEVISVEDLALEPSSPWFQPKDVVVIDPGGPNEEWARVAGLGSLIFATPLVRPHDVGEIVVLANGLVPPVGAVGDGAPVHDDGGPDSDPVDAGGRPRGDTPNQDGHMADRDSTGGGEVTAAAPTDRRTGSMPVTGGAALLALLSLSLGLLVTGTASACTGSRRRRG